MIPKKGAKTSIRENKLLFYITFFLAFQSKKLNTCNKNEGKRTTGRTNKKMLKVPGIDKTLFSLFIKLINPIAA